VPRARYVDDELDSRRERKKSVVCTQGRCEHIAVSLRVLHVEYAERGTRYGILFMFSLFCEYIDLECVRIHVIYRVTQAEYVINILVVAPQEHVNI